MSVPIVSQKPQRSWQLRLLANATIAYPLVLIGLFYAEWLLAWKILGHEPRWSDDDPMSIAGSSWLHVINSFGLIGFLPVGIAAIVSNLTYILLHRLSAAQAGIRLMTLVCFWLTWWAWIKRDPHPFLDWWLD